MVKFLMSTLSRDAKFARGKTLIRKRCFFYLSIKWGLTYLKSGAYNKKKYCKYIQSDLLQKCS